MQNVRTVFLSDVHLGSRHCRSDLLLEFLGELQQGPPPAKLYIVGDFIDGWKLKRRWCWDDRCSLVIGSLLSLMRQGAEIYYAAGNHDEFLRQFFSEYRGHQFGSIHFGDRFVHVTADQRRLLVLHGDQFDFAMRNAPWLCLLGDVGYELLLKVNTLVYAVRRQLKLPDWSLSRAVKCNVKKAVRYVSDFERLLVNFGRAQQCEGCVCGHIHHPEIRWFGDFLYCNTGDWVESCTAIIEKSNGGLYLWDHGGRVQPLAVGVGPSPQPWPA